MKKLIVIICIIAGVFLFAINTIYGKEKSYYLGNNTANALIGTKNAERIDNDTLYNNIMTIDSVVKVNNETYSLNIRQKPSENYYKFEDAEWVEIEVQNNTKTIYSRKLSKETFAEFVQDIYDASVFCFKGIDSANVNGFVLAFSITVPDTDNTYFFRYIISLDGKTKIIKEEFYDEDDF